MKRADLNLGMTVAVSHGKYVTPYQATVVYLDPYHTSQYRRRGDARLTFTYGDETLTAPINVTTFNPSPQAVAREVLVRDEGGLVRSVPLTHIKPVEHIEQRAEQDRAKAAARRRAEAARRDHHQRVTDAVGRVNALLPEVRLRTPYVNSPSQEVSMPVATLEALLDLAEGAK